MRPMAAAMPVRMLPATTIAWRHVHADGEIGGGTVTGEWVAAPSGSPECDAEDGDATVSAAKAL